MDEVTEPPDDFAPEADLLAEALRTLGEHWLRPEEEWRPMCDDCAYGTCPRVISAEARLRRLAKQTRRG